MNIHDTDIGYCRCGCGQKTTIAPHNHAKYGWIKGNPLAYIKGHRGKGASQIPAESRFWKKVEKISETGCWIWKGNRSHNGYGRFWMNGKNRPAHQFAYELRNGHKPDGAEICHHCDNPACVNPDHLFAGSHMDNIIDSMQKGRRSSGKKHSDAISPNRPRGSTHHNSRFTEKDVTEMRRLYDSGEMSQHKIAQKYKVAQPVVQRIVKRVSWSHL